ncbi:MAG: tRNA (adenosine(37)-N6)-dimethylallyltransferase MiaA [Candidatus Saccharimonadales bacterium]|jgi:tRNA dimethylallyltransferase
MAAINKSILPLIVIVGETGSGKSALALKLAQQFNGEIIAADSRTIYKGLNIGTAKPSHADQILATHHLLDITTPDKPITVVKFKHLALNAISSIKMRGKIPILVGGSGLYIDAVIFDYNFLPAPDPIIRNQLEQLTISELQEVIKRRGTQLPENYLNKRYLIRTIETKGKKPTKSQLQSNTILIGLSISKNDLTKRLEDRARSMLNLGLIKETKIAVKKYGWGAEALRAPAYKSVQQFLEGHISKNEIIGLCVSLDLKLAKKQRTWFKRNKSIQWVEKQIQAVDIITTFLNKQ